MNTDIKCQRCGTEMTWRPPNDRWLGHFECPECCLAWHHQAEQIRVHAPGRTRRVRRAIMVLVQGMISRERLEL